MPQMKLTPKQKRTRPDDENDDDVFTDESRANGQGEKLTADSSGIGMSSQEGSHQQDESHHRNSSLKESLENERKKRKEENRGDNGGETGERDKTGGEKEEINKSNGKIPKRDHRPPALKILAREEKDSDHMPVVETG